jgi:hypothetical protein
MVIQEGVAALRVAPHEHNWLVGTTAMVAVPPAAGMAVVDGVSVKKHSAGAWLIAISWPATVTTPVRTTGSGLAATVNVTDPWPVPEDGVSVIHGAAGLTVAVQGQAAALGTTWIVPLAPCDGAPGVDEVTVNWQTIPSCVTVSSSSLVAVIRPTRGVRPGLAATV